MSDQMAMNSSESADVARAARPGERPSDRPDRGGQLADSLWSVGEVSAYLQLSTHSVYKMTARKASVRIPHIRIGGKLRFRRVDVDRWLSLLTVSNLDTLTKMRGLASKGKHGNDP